MCWPVGSLRYHPTTTPCSGGSKRCAAASVSPTSCSVAPSAITCGTRTTPCATTYDIPVSGAWSTRPTRYPSSGRWRAPTKWSSTAASVRCAMKIRLVSPSGGASSWMAGRHRTDCAVGGGCAGNSLIMLPRCTGRARDTRRLATSPAARHDTSHDPLAPASRRFRRCRLPAPRSPLPAPCYHRVSPSAPQGFPPRPRCRRGRDRLVHGPGEQLHRPARSRDRQGHGLRHSHSHIGAARHRRRPGWRRVVHGELHRSTRPARSRDRGHQGVSAAVRGA